MTFWLLILCHAIALPPERIETPRPAVRIVRENEREPWRPRR